MPNNVTSYLSITGPLAEVEALLEKAAGVHEDGKEALFLFNAFIPQPPDLQHGGCSHRHAMTWNGEKNTEEDLKCWYPWNITNWGTKWGAYEVTVDRDGVESALTQLARTADCDKPDLHLR